MIQLTFDDFGRSAGFEKKAGSWYHRSDEVIAVCNLQKSNYGPRYYVNQGFYIRELGDELYPKAHLCHVQLRLEDLLPAEEERIGELLDLERGPADEQRSASLRALLVDKVLPLIDRASDVAGLRGMHAAGVFRAAGITGPARALLGSGR